MTKKQQPPKPPTPDPTPTPDPDPTTVPLPDPTPLPLPPRTTMSNEQKIPTFISITKLNKKNYSLWSWLCQDALETIEVWDIVSNATVVPTDPAELLSYQRKERRAKTQIKQSLEEGEFSHVLKCATAKEMWDSLKEVYESTNPMRQVYLNKKISTMKMVEGTDLRSHLDEFENTVASLVRAGKTVDDEFIAQMMLNSLPDTERWITVREIVVAALPSGTKMSTTLIREKLLSREYNSQQSGLTGGAFNTATLYGALPTANAAVGSSSDIKCYDCCKLGHRQFAHECPNLILRIEHFGSEAVRGRGGFGGSRGRGDGRGRGSGSSRGRGNGHSANVTEGTDNPAPPQDQSANMTYAQQYVNMTVVDSPSWTLNEALATTINECNSVSASPNPLAFHLDSACTQHMVHTRTFFTTYTILEKRVEIKVANGESIWGIGQGSMKLPAVVNDELRWVTFTNVLFVPGITRNLISVPQLAGLGLNISFMNKRCTASRNNEIIFTGSGIGNLYAMDIDTSIVDTKEDHVANLTVSDKDLGLLWHRRFGHLGNNNLQLLASKSLVSGLPDSQLNPVIDCEVCAREKSTRLPFSISTSRAQDLLELVHSDLVGPLPKSIGGAEYLVSWGDDKSRKFWVYFIRTKSQVLECYKDFRAKVELQSGRKIKRIRTDNGGEYTSKEFERMLADEGTVHELTNPYTPQQNGRAERFNRTIMDRTRCMLDEANLDAFYWAEAANTATYLMNRSPHRGIGGDVPEKVWSGKTPDVSHLRVFGSKVFYLIPKELRKKLEPRAREAIFVGYDELSKGYRLIDKNTRKFIRSRDVIFHERNIPESIPSINHHTQDNDIPVNHENEITSLPEPEVTTSDPPPLRRSERIQRLNQPEPIPEPVHELEPPTLRRSERIQNLISSEAHSAHSIVEPKSLKEALNGPQSDEWKAAVDKEMSEYS